MLRREIEGLALLTVFLIVNGSQVLAQSEHFYGAYQSCPFACETIQINRDGTFVHQLDGDLFNNTQSRGTWKFVSKDRIRAVSASASTDLQVLETESTRSGSFLVTFIDAVGALIPGARISGVVKGVAFEHESNDTGVVEIPECEQFKVAWAGSPSYRGVYRIKNPDAKEFTITMTKEQMFETYIDETWQVEKGCLYVVESDGSLNRDYCLKKLSRKKAEKIFGTAMSNKALQLTAR